MTSATLPTRRWKVVTTQDDLVTAVAALCLLDEVANYRRMKARNGLDAEQSTELESALRERVAQIRSHFRAATTP